MYFDTHAIPVKSAPARAAASPRSVAPEKARKVLVAFDGSPAAQVALDYAVDRARADGSSLHVLNVQEALVDNAATYHAYRKRGELILENVVERLAPHDVRFTVEIAFGSPARAIVRTAQGEQVDHIVIGTRNKSGFGAVLSSPVSHEVVQLSHVPVTILKEAGK